LGAKNAHRGRFVQFPRTKKSFYKLNSATRPVLQQLPPNIENYLPYCFDCADRPLIAEDFFSIHWYFKQNRFFL